MSTLTSHQALSASSEGGHHQQQQNKTNSHDNQNTTNSRKQPSSTSEKAMKKPLTNGTVSGLESKQGERPQPVVVVPADQKWSVPDPSTCPPPIDLGAVGEDDLEDRPMSRSKNNQPQAANLPKGGRSKNKKANWKPLPIDIITKDERSRDIRGGITDRGDFRQGGFNHHNNNHNKYPKNKQQHQQPPNSGRQSTTHFNHSNNISHHSHPHSSTTHNPSIHHPQSSSSNSNHQHHHHHNLMTNVVGGSAAGANSSSTNTNSAQSTPSEKIVDESKFAGGNPNRSGAPNHQQQQKKSQVPQNSNDRNTNTSSVNAVPGNSNGGRMSNKGLPLKSTPNGNNNYRSGSGPTFGNGRRNKNGNDTPSVTGSSSMTGGSTPGSNSSGRATPTSVGGVPNGMILPGVVIAPQTFDGSPIIDYSVNATAHDGQVPQPVYYVVSTISSPTPGDPSKSPSSGILPPTVLTVPPGAVVVPTPSFAGTPTVSATTNLPPFYTPTVLPTFTTIPTTMTGHGSPTGGPVTPSAVPFIPPSHPHQPHSHHIHHAHHHHHHAGPVGVPTAFSPAPTLVGTAMAPTVLPVVGPVTVVGPVDPEGLKEKIRSQIEYYFSEANLQRDMFIRKKMDSEGYLPISLIASFHRVQSLTQDVAMIINSLEESSHVELSDNHLKVRPRVNPTLWPLVNSEGPSTST